MTDLGMIRVAAVSPKLKVANTEYNREEIIKCINKANAQGAGIILFPALSITGASCGDLFSQEFLYKEQLKSLKEIVLSTKGIDASVVLGLYVKYNDLFIECGALIQNGEIKGITPKYYSTDYNNSDKGRFFSSSCSIECGDQYINILGCDLAFGHIIFKDIQNELSLALEIGDDSLAPFSPGPFLASKGALIIANPAASPELIGSSDLRLKHLLKKSGENYSAYLYSSAGPMESSSQGVYSGHCLIAENGNLVIEDSTLSLESKITISDIDYMNLKNARLKNKGFYQREFPSNIYTIEVDISPMPVLNFSSTLLRTLSGTPFLPEDRQLLYRNCSEALQIQSMALARRLLHTGAKKAVLGVSGGLDSTLALLVAARAMKILNRPYKDIITVTMPGFGTSGRTYKNAITMMEALATDIREISIKDAVLLHFKDIGHNPAVKNTVYENVQARERTQILMDIANMEGGIAIGTGDLSEAALGWSTFNGDHMSMYSVNAGVPKTFISAMIAWFIHHISADTDEITATIQNPPFCNDDKKLAETLQEVLDTPISPELLPTDEDDGIVQKTEDQVGPYKLHDFFLYHSLKSGTPPKKLLFLAKAAFSNEYDEAFIKNWLAVFYKRFFFNQFKRSCVPDSPKIGTLNLSPKGDWLMASDADPSLWLRSLE